MPNKPLFTTIQHFPRLELGLTCNEYCVADVIHWGAYNPSNPSGWCYASKNYIALSLGLTKKTTLEIIERLIEKGIIEKDASSKHLRTTVKWYNALSLWSSSGNEITPQSVTKLHPTSNENTPQIGNEITPYNNTYKNKNNNSDIKERKTKFHVKIKSYKKDNPSKYPSKFYENFFKYWTETNELEGGNVMRFEKEKFFELGRRLSTFAKFVKAEDLSEWWKEDEATAINNSIDLFSIAKTVD